MSDFSVGIKHINEEVATVSVTGLLDANTFDEFDKSLNRVFEDSTFNVVVDFSGLDYVSSAGAGVLIGALSVAREHGGNIVIASPQKGVKEVFDLLGISQLFRITDDVDEALTILKQ